jgi:hypothetical protein
LQTWRYYFRAKIIIENNATPIKYILITFLSMPAYSKASFCFFVLRIVRDCWHVGTANAYVYTMKTIKVLFATLKGDEDWMEQLITECEDRIPSATAWATANGFDRIRVASIDMKSKPDFTKCINA